MNNALPTVDRPDPRQLYLSLLIGLFLGIMTCGMGLLGLIPIKICVVLFLERLLAWAGLG